MELLVHREISNTACTPGDMSVDGAYYSRTLEPIVREIPGMAVEKWKIWGRTAIPVGRYRVLMEFSPKFNRNMPHLQAVPGFSDIMIHPLNYPQETHGCIGVGQSMNQDQTALVSSRAAFSPLLVKIINCLENGDECWITVKNA